jgi:hypothetical protein
MTNDRNSRTFVFQSHTCRRTDVRDRVLDHGHRTILAHFVKNLRDRLLAQKTIGDAEVNDSVSESKRHIDDPCTMVLGGIFFQVGSPSRAITKTEHETREVSSEPERQPSRNVINVLPRGRLFQESSSEEV